MDIQLRRTTQDDLDFVLNAEQSAENRSFVSVWTRNEHLAALASKDLAHLIIERIATNRSVGYIILAGLSDANKSIEFRRIVVTEKNKGYGRKALFFSVTTIRRNSILLLASANPAKMM